MKKKKKNSVNVMFAWNSVVKNKSAFSAFNILDPNNQLINKP